VLPPSMDARFSIRLMTAPPMNAQIMVVNGPEVYGVLSEADEQDHYWFEAEAGKTYRVYTLGLSSGCDTILRVDDPDLLEIDTTDDYGAGGNASAVTFTAVQSGPHIATVASYQERIGTYGVRVVPGAATGFDLLDTSGMAIAVMVAVGDDPTPGVLSPAAESNWFRFRVSPGAYYLIETLDLTAGSGSTKCDTRLFLYRDGDRRPFRRNNDAYGRASLIGWVADCSGWAYVPQLRRVPGPVSRSRPDRLKAAGLALRRCFSGPGRIPDPRTGPPSGLENLVPHFEISQSLPLFAPPRVEWRITECRSLPRCGPPSAHA